MSNQKQYKRQSTSGDYQITGESSNGVNISKDGNTYLFTGNNEDYLNALRDGNIQTPDEQIETNDPNNAASFIGMYRQGGSNINLGNSNQQSLNINNSTEQNKDQNIITSEPSIVVSALPSTEPKPSPTPTPSPSLPIGILEEGIQEFSFEELPDEEGFQLFDPNEDQIINNNIVNGINSGEIKISSINSSSPKYNIPLLTLNNISQYVKFAGGGTVGSSNALQDWQNGIINPKLIIDIATAAKSAGVIATITTAKTGHNVKSKSGFTSRHVSGEGVDVAIINGTGSGGASNSNNGNPKFRELGNKLKNALVQMGYIWNIEDGKDKAVLWQTNKGGNHYNHLHISRRKQ